MRMGQKKRGGTILMKRRVCILLALTLLLSTFVSVSAADKVFTAKDVTEQIGDVKIENGVVALGGNLKLSAIGFKADLTGVKSIEIKAKEYRDPNGEIFRVKVDDPNSLSIGEIVFGDGSNTASGNISEQNGVHTVYLYTTLLSTGAKWEIETITLKSEAKKLVTPVPDDKIIDNWHDTWAATDSYGRRVADFEETGPVKEGNRKVGMFYWPSLTTGTTGVTPDILRAHPEAYGDFKNPAWKNGGKEIAYWWGEPVYGFYSETDYWVLKKHGTIMANAGVDAIFMDYTNDAGLNIKNYNRILRAFHDLREEGINAPKVSIYGNMAGKTNGTPREVLPAMYYNQVKFGEWDDLIFYWEGDPMYINFPLSEKSKVTEDKDLEKLFTDIDFKLNLRDTGELRGGAGTREHRHVNWLEEYPQHPFGVTDSGRRETISLAVGINQSYVDGSSVVGVFSDPYTKGRAYSEAFGEDYRADNGRTAYFFREQAAHALNVDAEFVFVDGWNEWKTPNYNSYGTHTGTVFVDLFDEENSRDFEPSRSYLKDDYYNLLVDFIRKYKGTRPAPVATAAATIDINGAPSQWDSVGPMFYNDFDNYERDYTGGKDFETGEPVSYKTTVNNSISRAKVARDNDNFYFYVKTVNPIKTGTPGFMNLYINSDRNPATGWEGFDYSVNVAGDKVLAKAVNNSWSWEPVGNINYTVSGDVLQMAIPRSLLGETGTVDFEFKWTDSLVCDGDYLDFYSEGSVAPMGKFNYVYTEVEQTALTQAERDALPDVSILKAGTSKAIIDGGKMPVYEKDTAVAPFEMNGTLYVPLETYEEILDYGFTKVEYSAEDNTVYLGRHDLEPNSTGNVYTITNYEWTYSVVGSLEARNNGTLRTLTNACVTANGLVYVPVSYAADVFGWSVRNVGGGIWTVSRNPASESAVNAVLHHLG